MPGFWCMREPSTIAAQQGEAPLWIATPKLLANEPLARAMLIKQKREKTQQEGYQQRQACQQHCTRQGRSNSLPLQAASHRAACCPPPLVGPRQAEFRFLAVPLACLCFRTSRELLASPFRRCFAKVLVVVRARRGSAKLSCYLLGVELRSGGHERDHEPVMAPRGCAERRRGAAV